MWPADNGSGRDIWHIGVLWAKNGAQGSKYRLNSHIRKHTEAFCFILFKTSKLKRFFYEQLEM